MFDEEKIQACKDCGRKYLTENLIIGRSWEWWLCIRCYNRRKNEKNAKTKTRERENQAGHDCIAQSTDLEASIRALKVGPDSQHTVETVREKGDSEWRIK